MLINIQTLRFIAASMVVLYHAIPVCYSSTDIDTLNIFRIIGFSGVDIFFVISGYIIWHTTRNIEGFTDLKKFLTRRVCRIYSGYIPFLVIAYIVYFELSNRNPSHIDIIGSLFLLPIGVKERILPVSWTLTYELFFYIYFSCLILLKPQKRIYLITFAFVLIVLINLVGISYYDFYSKSFFESNTLTSRILYSPYNLEFLAGALLSAYSPLLKRIRPLTYIVLFTLLFTTGGIYNALLIDLKMESGYYVVYRVFFFGTASVFLVGFFVLLDDLKIRIIPRLGAVLGGASYSIYLSHTIIFEAYRYTNIVIENNLLLYLYTFVLLYSVIHYKYVERPLYKSTTSRLLSLQNITT